MRSASSLSILLLLLLLLHPGLQYPLRPQASSQVPGSNQTVNCSVMILEMLANFDANLEEPVYDAKVKLMNPTLWMKHLCAFQKTPARHQFSRIGNINRSLETLERCLDRTETSSMGDGIFIRDGDDFQKYLKYYLIQLDEFLPPRLISISSDTNRTTC